MALKTTLAVDEFNVKVVLHMAVNNTAHENKWNI